MSLRANRNRPRCMRGPEQGLSPFSTISSQIRQGRWRARWWRNHCSFCAAIPLERRGRLMVRHRGRLPYSAGPRITWAARFSRRASRFGRSETADGRPPGAMLLADGSYWPSGGASRRRPEWEEAHIGLKSRCALPMTGHCLTTIVMPPTSAGMTVDTPRTSASPE